MDENVDTQIEIETEVSVNNRTEPNEGELFIIQTASSDKFWDTWNKIYEDKFMDSQNELEKIEFWDTITDNENCGEVDTEKENDNITPSMITGNGE